MLIDDLVHKWKVPRLRIPVLEDSGTYWGWGELNSRQGEFFRWSDGDKEGREEGTVIPEARNFSEEQRASLLYTGTLRCTCRGQGGRHKSCWRCLERRVF